MSINELSMLGEREYTASSIYCFFFLRAKMELMEGRLVIVIPPVACFRSGRYSLV